MSLWHYLDNGKQMGPISEEELQNLVFAGRIRAQDLVWTEGMAEWQAVGSLPHFECPATPPGRPAAAAAARYASQGAYAPAQAVPNYLPWAIAATVLCCLPTGVAAIVYASKATSAQNVGNYDEAKKAADSAKIWLIVSVILGLVTTILAFAIQILLAVASA